MAKLEQGLEEFNTRQQFRLWRRLGSAYLNLVPPENEQAQRCWEQALQLSPGHVEVLNDLFMLATSEGDQIGMQGRLNKIEEQFGKDDSIWQYRVMVR